MLQPVTESVATSGFVVHVPAVKRIRIQNCVTPFTAFAVQLAGIVQVMFPLAVSPDVPSVTPLSAVQALPFQYSNASVTAVACTPAVPKMNFARPNFADIPM